MKLSKFKLIQIINQNNSDKLVTKKTNLLYKKYIFNLYFKQRAIKMVSLIKSKIAFVKYYFM